VRALDLAFETGMTPYDTQFIALAEHYEAMLITEDKQLRDKFGRLTSPIRQFLRRKT